MHNDYTTHLNLLSPTCHFLLLIFQAQFPDRKQMHYVDQ